MLKVFHNQSGRSRGDGRDVGAGRAGTQGGVVAGVWGSGSGSRMHRRGGRGDAVAVRSSGVEAGCWTRRCSKDGGNKPRLMPTTQPATASKDIDFDQGLAASVGSAEGTVSVPLRGQGAPNVGQARVLARPSVLAEGVNGKHGLSAGDHWELHCASIIPEVGVAGVRQHRRKSLVRRAVRMCGGRGSLRGGWGGAPRLKKPSPTTQLPCLLHRHIPTDLLATVLLATPMLSNRFPATSARSQVAPSHSGRSGAQST